MYITELRSSDYDRVLEVSKNLFEFSPFKVDDRVVRILGEENIHKVSLSILENSTGTFVGVSGGRILGFLAWTFDRNLTSITARRYYRIRLLGVDKGFQRKGIGSELLKYFLEFVGKQKGEIIEVSTDVNNLPAIRTYLKFNFFYTSSFTTLRLFPEKFNFVESGEVSVIRISNVENLDAFTKLRLKNIDFRNYPIQCLFDWRIEDRTKSSVLQNYHKSIENNLSSFGVYIGYLGKMAVGYGVIKEDFAISSVLSKVSGKRICVYRVFDLFVLENFRNEGVGRTILAEMIKDVSKSYDFIEAIVPSHNYPMLNTLVKVGFRVSHVMLNLAY